MSKYLIIGYDGLIDTMFLSRGWDKADSIDQTDLVIFTGGADVSPELYGEYNQGLSHCNYTRDLREVEVFEYCLANKIACVGICRGAQLLTVLNGGKLVQDYDTEYPEDRVGYGSHDIVDYETGQIIETSHTHHQVQIPDLSKGELLSVDTRTCSVEGVFYPETRCYCQQGHPEYNDDAFRDYFYSILNKKLGFT